MMSWPRGVRPNRLPGCSVTVHPQFQYETRWRFYTFGVLQKKSGSSSGGIVQPKEAPWPKTKSAVIRLADAKHERAAIIAVLIVNQPVAQRRSNATAGIRNVRCRRSCKGLSLLLARRRAAVNPAFLASSSLAHEDGLLNRHHRPFLVVAAPARPLDNVNTVSRSRRTALHIEALAAVYRHDVIVAI